MMDLLQAAQAVEGAVYGGNPLFTGVGADSRASVAGQLFVALKGPRFDGHAYLAEVAHAGAAGAMVDAAWHAAHGAPLPVVAVKDTLAGLGALAAEWRSRFAIPLVALTGSNGKTTTKEMTAAILCAQMVLDGDDPEVAVLATAGNLNNDIGLPLTLLRLRHGHRHAVVEMGMNRPGEIAYLAGLTRPVVALVTNAQRAHLQGLGSLDAVAREKGSIYGALDEDGVAVINADDPHAALWRDMARGRRIVTFGIERPADVSARVTPHGLHSRVRMVAAGETTELLLRVPGLHNARNAMGAAATALAVGASLQAVRTGLEAFVGVRGRLQQRKGWNGATVLDDSYNANPDSLRAAIDVLASTPGRTVLVMGDMGEIGDRAGQFHDEAGGYAKSAGIDALLAVGEHAAVAARNFGQGGAHFKGVEELVAALCPLLGPDSVVLVKGSRFMRMERVVDALCAGGSGAAAPVAGAREVQGTRS